MQIGQRCYCKREVSGEPAVDQGKVAGNQISWNPDDGLFYVGPGDLEVKGRFADWRNAVQFAKRHKR